MKPQPGVRVTIVSREVESPYSGMLPGHIAGIYERSEMHVDLGRLAVFAGARLLADEVVGLDLSANSIQLAAHPTLRFDLLSINIGGVPVGVSEHVIPVKPIGRFLPHWERIRATVKPGERIAVVGGGAGGVELAMAMRASLPAVGITVVCEELLPAMADEVHQMVKDALRERRIGLVEEFRVVSATAAGLTGADGRVLDADCVFWVTGVAAAPFAGAAGLETDHAGFVIVDRHLRSVSHPQVFAAGDIAALAGQPRPKSGVFAVREGPVLARNLRRALLGRRLVAFKAQERFLTLMGTGDRRAIASKGTFNARGRWVWLWKDWIDRRFMRRFNRLPDMAPQPARLPKALRRDAPDPMRCGGCGAKLGATPLLRVLSRLPEQSFDQVVLGIGDDAALIRTSGDIILTVDGFRSLISDPYLFGRITAHHSLNDVLAMGGRGVSALALATVPLMAEAMMEDDLYQLLKGAVDVLNAHNVALVGGHSAEALELALSLTITGTLDSGPALLKSGLETGQALLLTKALGTGTVLAAHMRARLPTPELEVATASLDQSNADAIAILRACGTTAVTDVSGFGFAGHLSEMLRASKCGALIDVSSIPALPGALRLLAGGIHSSLQDNNLEALADFDIDLPADAPEVALLADPQTSGGLLAGIPSAQAEACVSQLQLAGYAAAVVGRVTADSLRIVRGV
jgi:selenide,water dikinase